MRRAETGKTTFRRARNGRAKPSELILSALRREGRPLGAYDLQASLSEVQFLAPATIYRALEQLIADRLVHKIASLNAFIACRHRNQNGRSAFAICDSCGDVQEISNPDLESVVETCSRQSGFAVSGATIELHGSCIKCCEHILAAE